MVQVKEEESFAVTVNDDMVAFNDADKKMEQERSKTLAFDQAFKGMEQDQKDVRAEKKRPRKTNNEVMTSARHETSKRSERKDQNCYC